MAKAETSVAYRLRLCRILFIRKDLKGLKVPVKTLNRFNILYNDLVLNTSRLYLKVR
jgi:hypothetical protein